MKSRLVTSLLKNAPVLNKLLLGGSRRTLLTLSEMGIGFEQSFDGRNSCR